MTAIEFPTAIREWGFQPFSCTAEQNTADIEKTVDYIHALIESNISTIVCYFWEEDDGRMHGHAVTAFGHRLGKTLRKEADVRSRDVRSIADWIDVLIVSDDQRAPYTFLLVKKKQESKDSSCEQPLGWHKVLKWANGVTTSDRASVCLKDCERVLVYAPLPTNVHITPKEVLPIARGMLSHSEEALEKLRQAGNKLTTKILPQFQKVISKPAAFALKPTLYELWEFHWKFKTDRAFTKLSQDIRAYYFSLSVPLWIWLVQVIELEKEKEKEDMVVWDRCKVVGEILIDATETPRSPLGGAFLVRLGPGMVEIDRKERCSLKLYAPTDVVYPLILPQD